MSKQNGQQPDYLTDFIINAGKVEFETNDGRKWLMRQPAPEEYTDASSAYRLAYQRVMNDKRLRDLAGDEEILKREAHMRGRAAEALYILPLLLENEQGQVVFNVHDPADMAEFERMDPAITAEMTAVYLGQLMEAIVEAKKKSHMNSPTKLKSAGSSDNGRSRRRRKK